MTYRVTLRNADSAWVIEDRTVDSLQKALQLKTQWFREFHEPIVEEWGLRPGLINLAVTVSIGRGPGKNS